jgi:hypothetical protein
VFHAPTPPWLRATITVAILLVSSASLAAVVEVDTCGQLVRGKGVLVADLDCAGRNLPALTTGQRASRVRCSTRAPRWSRGACSNAGPHDEEVGVELHDGIENPGLDIVGFSHLGLHLLTERRARRSKRSFDAE